EQLFERSNEPGHLGLGPDRNSQPIVHRRKLSSYKNLALLELIGDRGYILAHIDHKKVGLRRNDFVAPTAQVLDGFFAKIYCHMLDFFLVRGVLQSCNAAVLHHRADSAATERARS